MNVLERAYRTWVKLTILIALASACVVGFFFFRKIVTLHSQSRDLHYELIVGSLERDYSKISEEIYLNLDTLPARQKALQLMMGSFGESELAFVKANELSKNRLNLCLENEDCRETRMPMHFENLYLGDLSLKVKFVGVDLLKEIFNPSVVYFTIFFVSMWIGVFWGIKKRVLEPIGKSLQEESEARAVASIAKQIAHDIRSPLTALNTLTHRSSGLPEEHRYLAALAVKRINGIADALLRKEQVFAETKYQPLRGAESIDVIACVENIVSEKRLEIMKHQKNVEFEFTSSDLSLYANIDRIELERVISNLLNNAIEASPKDAKIHISANRSHKRITLEILDHGVGIANDLLAKVTNEGFSSGKNGSGLGLYHAKRTISNSGGSLKIQSEINKFTRVIVELRIAEAPFKFQDNVNLDGLTDVVILDDDESIHEVWRSRALRLNNGLRWHFFKDQTQLQESLISLRKSSTIFLLDHDISDGQRSGFDLINDFEIDNAILVTSKAEDKSIQGSCLKRGVRLLPKNWIAKISLSQNS